MMQLIVGVLTEIKYHVNTTRNEIIEKEHLHMHLFHQNKND